MGDAVFYAGCFLVFFWVSILVYALFLHELWRKNKGDCKPGYGYDGCQCSTCRKAMEVDWNEETP